MSKQTTFTMQVTHLSTSEGMTSKQVLHIVEQAIADHGLVPSAAQARTESEEGIVQAPFGYYDYQPAGVLQPEGPYTHEDVKLAWQTVYYGSELAADLEHALHVMGWALARQDQNVFDVTVENERQWIKWGDQSHHPDGTGPGQTPDLWHVDALEPGRNGISDRLSGDTYAEFAHWAKTQCQRMFADGQGNWALILLEEVFEALECEPDSEELESELNQIAAVALQWRRAIQKRRAEREEAHHG